MPTFHTPAPIALTIDLSMGGVRIVASERADTVVSIEPGDPSREADIRDAEQTLVEHADGRLLIRAPKRFSLFNRGSSVAVTVHVPVGSTLHLVAAMGELQVSGTLGECRVKLSMGSLHLERTGPVHLSTSMGDVSVDHVQGAADITTGSGSVRIGAVEGPAVVKNSNGATWIGIAGSGLRVSAGNGDIVVDRAGGGVEAKSANGDIRLLSVARETVSLQTAAGALEVGIAAGSAAWLDVRSAFGRVESSLQPSDSPDASAETVEVRGRTSYGDIIVRRA